MKYKVGDKAKVKEDLICNNRYGNNSFADSMKGYKGKIVTIDKENTGTGYLIKEDSRHYLWTEEMLEPVSDKPRICEVLGVKVGQKFNIISHANNPFYLDDNMVLRDGSEGRASSKTLIDIINNPSLIEVIPEYTPKQREVFKAVKLLGKNYAAIDKCGEIYAFEAAPEKDAEDDIWTEGAFDSFEIVEDSTAYKILKPLLSWEQDEPFKIPEEN